MIFFIECIINRTGGDICEKKNRIVSVGLHDDAVLCRSCNGSRSYYYRNSRYCSISRSFSAHRNDSNSMENLSWSATMARLEYNERQMAYRMDEFIIQVITTKEYAMYIKLTQIKPIIKSVAEVVI